MGAPVQGLTEYRLPRRFGMGHSTDASLVVPPGCRIDAGGTSSRGITADSAMRAAT